MSEQSRREWAPMVISRAGDRCGYCLLARRLSRIAFQLERIIAPAHGGASERGNLAWSCMRCNCYKGTNPAGIDPVSGGLCRLYHPREDR